MTTVADPALEPTGEVNPEPILKTFAGYMASKYLFVANEIGLFAQLGEASATIDELATRCGVPRRTLRILTDAIVALGLLERHGDRYSNSPTTATFLSSGPADLGPFIRMANQLLYPRWLKLEQAVRTDERLFGELEFTNHEQQLFSEGVEAASAGHAYALATTYDFSPHRRLLDLGGGTGSFLVAVLDRYPKLRATLFELPGAAAVARKRLAAEPTAGRIEIATGDFFCEPIPEGHDAVILSHVIHCFTPERNLKLLERLREHVPQGARLLLVDFWTDPTHTQPLFAALMAGEFLLAVGGDVYSTDEATGWLNQTGWKAVQHTQLAGPASLIIAEAG
jgi:ubiquinone/menaquinone biosynthesis C-methylase UbiE